jgi:hypothetical protein
MNERVQCHHGMARPQAEGTGNGIQISRAAANRLNKQCGQPTRGDSEGF